ncbi:hypothetical protein JW935_09775 [candidate division KSB1 bacterium]|nr:hypothetical protein [candidate division KSB1 bacterium]
MPVTLFYSIGNSDVEIDGRTRVTPFREITRRLYEIIRAGAGCPRNGTVYCRNGFLFKQPVDLAEVVENSAQPVQKVYFPVFFALWNFLPAKPENIIFFATDQNEPHDTDTVFAAQMLAYFMIYQKVQVIVEMIRDNPSDYDDMAAWFERYASQNSKILANNLENYYSLSTGTPAMSSSFALSTLEYPVDFYYVSRQQPLKIRRVDRFEWFKKQNSAQVIGNFIQKYQYASALNVVEKSSFRADYKLTELLRAATCRFQFDFESALEHGRNLDSEGKNIFRAVGQILNNRKDVYLGEILSHIEIALEIGDFHRAVAIIFNCLENIRSIVLQKFTGIELVKKKNRFLQWENYIKNNTSFSQNDKNDLLKHGPVRVGILRVLKHVAQTNDDKVLNCVINFLDKCEKTHHTDFGPLNLVDLRNKGPFAHGRHGVTKQLLDQLWPPYGARQMFDELKDICDLLTNITYCNYFKKLNELLMQKLKH